MVELVQTYDANEENLMHANEVVWYEGNGGTKWETSNLCCIMRKVMLKEVAAGGRFEFFLGSTVKYHFIQAA